MQFIPGDKIIYTNKSSTYNGIKEFTAVILRGNPNTYMYTIEFDNKNLIPPTMQVHEHTLRINNIIHKAIRSATPINNITLEKSLDKKTSDIDTNKYCPKCKNEWTITDSIYNQYYDCLKCSIKREDILKP